jgi:hypothetical protein
LLCGFGLGTLLFWYFGMIIRNIWRKKMKSTKNKQNHIP